MNVNKLYIYILRMSEEDKHNRSLFSNESIYNASGLGYRESAKDLFERWSYIFSSAKIEYL